MEIEWLRTITEQGQRRKFVRFAKKEWPKLRRKFTQKAREGRTSCSIGVEAEIKDLAIDFLRDEGFFVEEGQHRYEYIFRDREEEELIVSWEVD